MKIQRFALYFLQFYSFTLLQFYTFTVLRVDLYQGSPWQCPPPEHPKRKTAAYIKKKGLRPKGGPFGLSQNLRQYHTLAISSLPENAKTQNRCILSQILAQAKGSPLWSEAIFLNVCSGFAFWVFWGWALPRRALGGVHP